jgi:hypothetical protein
MGVIWMIGPFIIFAVSDNITGEIIGIGAGSFIMGLLAFNYKSKEVIELKNSQPNPIYQKSIVKPTKTAKAKVDIIVRDINLIQKDPVRYMTGSPGEVSRVLTQNYYNLFFGNIKTTEKALEFLEYRTKTFSAITGTEINHDSLKEISKLYCNNISTLIFFLSYHENFSGEFDIFKDEYVSDVYKIITEEHNKVCLLGQEEVNEFKMDMFSNIKSIYSKYNRIDSSLNKIGFEIFDDYGENDGFDFENDEFDFDDVDEEIDNFDDVDFNKDTIIMCIDKFENEMNEMLEKFIPDNSLKDNPMEGMEMLTQMQDLSTELKAQLVLNKIEIDLNDREIEYIISEAYTNVYQKHFNS